MSSGQCHSKAIVRIMALPKGETFNVSNAGIVNAQKLCETSLNSFVCGKTSRRTPSTRNPSTRNPSTRNPSTRTPSTRNPSTRNPSTRNPSTI